MNLEFPRLVSFWDLGSHNGRLYTRELGVVVNDNTYVCVRSGTGEVEMVGRDAFVLSEKTPTHLTAIATIQAGVTADEQMLSKLLSRWKLQIKEREWRSLILRPVAVVTVPVFIDKVHLRATKRAFLQAGFGEVIFIPTSLALLAFHNFNLLSGCCLVCDMGAGKIEVSLCFKGSIVKSIHSSAALNSFKDDLICFLAETYAIQCSQEEITNLLHAYSLLQSKQKLSLHLRGKDLKTGASMTLTLQMKDLGPLFESFLDNILETYLDLTENLPANMSSELHNSGIILAGGMSKIDGLESWFSNKVRIPVTSIARPELAAVLGSARIFADWKKFSYMRI